MKVVTESIFSGDNSNYEPENSETEDEEPNTRENDTDDDTDDNLPSAGGWSAASNQKPKLSHKKYRQLLVKSLVGDVRNREGRKRGRPSTSDEEERLNRKPHFIYSNEKSNSKDCAVCSNRKIKG
jgi:hypothetical protein